MLKVCERKSQIGIGAASPVMMETRQVAWGKRRSRSALDGHDPGGRYVRPVGCWQPATGDRLYPMPGIPLDTHRQSTIDNSLSLHQGQQLLCLHRLEMSPLCQAAQMLVMDSSSNMSAAGDSMQAGCCHVWEWERPYLERYISFDSFSLLRQLPIALV
jgi:hypothetical protein